MRYRANKKLSRRCRLRHQQEPHQKQYVPLPFGGGHKNSPNLFINNKTLQYVWGVPYSADIIWAMSRENLSSGLWPGKTQPGLLSHRS